MHSKMSFIRFGSLYHVRGRLRLLFEKAIVMIRNCRPFLALLFWGVVATALIAQDAKPKLILDADTANEIDDQYAIIRFLRQDKFDVIGLNSAQWGASDSVQASQELNEKLLRLMGSELPTFLGAERPIGEGDELKESAAAQFIIKSVRALPDDQQLYVVSTGASTNLASAIKMAPEIAPKIKAYLMGFRYDFEAKAWNKSEYNVSKDLNAAEFLLNQKDLELHVMSATTSGVFKFAQADSFEKHGRMGPLGEQLTSRWREKFGSSKTWVMWDLTLVEAMLDPTLATEEQVMTPPENIQRKVWMYRTIDVQKMQDAFWKAALVE